MSEPPAVVVAQRQPDHVYHRRSQRRSYSSHSRITVANATPFSSESEIWDCVTPLFFRNFFKASENSSTGLPEGRFTTHTPCHLAADRIPLPAAWPKAAFPPNPC